MAEVQWIKITTSMFDDDKIDFIESLPERDSILIIWIKLLTMAGKCNSSGYIFLTEKIPYDVEMLAHKLRRPINTIKLALETLSQLDMIEFSEEKILKIVNWEKHQNVEGLETIREQRRIRQAKYREKQKQKEKLLNDSNVTDNVRSRDSNAIEEDKELEEELDKEKEIKKKDIKEPKGSMSVKTDSESSTRIDWDDIKDVWNEKSMLTEIRSITDKRKKHLNARIKEHGLDAIYEAIEQVSQSKFMHGENNRKWMATFDWVFSSPNNFLKTLEGNYSDKNPSNNPTWESDVNERVKRMKEYMGVQS